LAVNPFEVRISQVKQFLHQEIRLNKTGAVPTLNLREIGYHMDTLHEIERVGLRNLNDVQSLRLSRVLEAVEVQMKPSDN